MKLHWLSTPLTVCKVAAAEDVPLTGEPLFIGKTDEELSVVCPTEAVPLRTTAREDGWRAFRVVGAMDFSLIGVLAKLSAILAEQKIGIFVISTFNTDYVLVKEENARRAEAALTQGGYEFE